MIAYKLLRVRKDGTLGPLFINRSQVIPLGEWLQAEPHQTKGYKFRPGWHCVGLPRAPHLSSKNRAWYRVRIDRYEHNPRPDSQGGMWYIAQKMKVLEAVNW